MSNMHEPKSLFVATEFQELLDWSDSLSGIMQARGRTDLVEQISESKRQLQANTFTLAVIGKAKRGKSTLINAILGRNDDLVAPIDKLPTSSAITRFGKGTEKATVVYQDHRSEEITYSRIKDFVTEESNPRNQKNIAMVEVLGRFPELPSQVVLVDTPGAGSIHEHHDVLLHAFIPNADAIIFVLTARMPLDQDELDLLKEIKAADVSKIFFVLNKIDESEQQDIEDAIAHNEKLLNSIGLSVGKFHRISAKRAFQGESDTGLPELLADIGEYCHNNKGKVLRRRFLAKVNGTIESEARAVEIALASSGKTTEELDAEIHNLQKQRLESAGGGEYTGREFERNWRAAVLRFDSAIVDAEAKVRDNLIELVNITSTFGLGKLVKELPSYFNQQIELHLKPASNEFEIKAKELCEQLNAEYPALSVNADGKVIVKVRSDLTAEKGLVTGGVLAAGGFGFATAGASTAATIAASNAAALAAYSTATSAVAGGATAAGWLAAGGIALDSVATILIGTPLGLSGAGLAGASAVASAVPAAAAPTLATTPLWVAVSGPIGWTLAGIGVLAVPFCWRLAKLKQKDKIEAETRKQVAEIFQCIREKRIASLREAGESIISGYRNHLNYQLKQFEDSLTLAKLKRPDSSELDVLRSQCDSMVRLVTQGAEWFNACR
jgi:ribosome biogenesis GTPase A